MTSMPKCGGFQDAPRRVNACVYESLSRTICAAVCVCACIFPLSCVCRYLRSVLVRVYE